MSESNGKKVDSIREEIYSIVQTCQEAGIKATTNVISDRLNIRTGVEYTLPTISLHLNFLVTNARLEKSDRRPYTYTPIAQEVLA